eukprot:TRINITY_DN15719_c0_g1_i2.p1 TRINITY_DN15719_c0_g1~~TRINITY_DN15719_c0_g1_i2.p1  ORF type:complete len:417 (+),score=48.45 TRINITY_DN15719_c0_g1_i2:37-1251(+)
MDGAWDESSCAGTSVLFHQVLQAAKSQTVVSPVAVRAGGHGGPERSFWRGVLGHLLLVPSWVVPPAALVGSSIVVGAAHGGKGLLTALALTGMLATGPSNKIRSILCAAFAVMAARSKTGRAKICAMLAAGMISLMTWVVSVAAPFPRSQFLFDYASRWAPDYYRKATLKFVDPEGVRPGRTFFAFHPHGCLSAGFTINGLFNPDFMRTAGTKVHWMIDSSLRHRNPGFRIMADGYLGEDRELVSCDKASFTKHMAAGHTVSFVPGGFLDAVAFEYGKDVTVLSDRKAFIKLCLQFGYRLHPCYTFGECDTYTTFTPLRNLRMKVGRNGIPCLAFFGFPLIPFLPWTSSSIMTYIGRGIDFPTIQSPSVADIDHWHSLYQSKLRELFDEYKAEAGKPDAHLDIL